MTSRRKPLLGLLTALVITYFGFIGVIWWSMHQPPETFGHVMARMPVPAVFIIAPFETFWIHARAGALLPGDSAPDFTLEKLDKSGSIQLSSLTSKQPVVLIFGSYT